ncbi:hypothetical protein KUH03_28565 [Sphingobacterium sp. E70]|nr:hypothetical protein [Sphingobacterium sp. E70]ULT23154.1 hypothetical protein KUH03_28565 [Sphingobacterium sp. E70]
MSGDDDRQSAVGAMLIFKLTTPLQSDFLWIVFQLLVDCLLGFGQEST